MIFTTRSRTTPDFAGNCVGRIAGSTGDMRILDPNGRLAILASPQARRAILDAFSTVPRFDGATTVQIDLTAPPKPSTRAKKAPPATKRPRSAMYAPPTKENNGVDEILADDCQAATLDDDSRDTSDAISPSNPTRPTPTIIEVAIRAVGSRTAVVTEMRVLATTAPCVSPSTRVARSPKLTGVLDGKPVYDSRGRLYSLFAVGDVTFKDLKFRDGHYQVTAVTRFIDAAGTMIERIVVALVALVAKAAVITKVLTAPIDREVPA